MTELSNFKFIRMQKNIFCFAICLLLLPAKTPWKHPKEHIEIISLFNGENLDMWRGEIPVIWSVEMVVSLTTNDENPDR